MRSTLVVLSLLVAFGANAQGTSNANEEVFICYQDKEQNVKLLDVSYDPVKEKRVGHLINKKLENVYQVENSLYGEDFFIEPTKNVGEFHISVNGNNQTAYCIGGIAPLDKDNASEKFGLSFASISF